MSLRLTTTKAKLEEMGEETEYACETLSEYRNLVLALTANTSKPVDIFGDDGQYKSTTQAMRELASVWHELDSMEQSSIMKALFGVRQANIGASLLENFDVVEAAIESASKASEGIGSAMEEQERWAESLEARINQVNSSLQVLSTDMFNTDGIKAFVSGMNEIVKAIDWVVKMFDASHIAIGAFVAWIANAKNVINATLTDTGIQFKLFGLQKTLFAKSSVESANAFRLETSAITEVQTTLQMYNTEVGRASILNEALATSIPKTTLQQYLVTLNGAEASLQGYCVWLAQSAVVQEDANVILQRYASLEAMGSNAQALFRNEIAKTNPVMAQYLAETNSATATLKGYESAVKAANISSKALAVTTGILKTALMGAATFVITFVIQKISDAIKRYDTLLEKSAEAITRFENEKTTLEDLALAYENLLTSTESQAEKEEKLKDIKKQLVEQYGFEEEKIKKINDLRREGLDLIDEEIQRQRIEAYKDAEKGFVKATQKMKYDTGITIGIDNNGIAGNDFIDTDNIRKEIQDLFDYTTYEVTSGHTTYLRDALGFSEENFLDYYDRLDSITTAMQNFKFENGEFTKDEQLVYDKLIKALDTYNKKYKDTLKTLEDGEQLAAEIIYNTFTKEHSVFESVAGTSDYERWFEELVEFTKERVDEDQIPFILRAYRLMFEQLKEDSTEPVEEVVDAFTELEAMILKAKQGLSELDGAVDKEADAFDKLLKVIKNNKDADKFFDQKEIIELLDTYPKLATALEKTEYGYKLNEEALENLKEAMLAEKKEALYAELDKTKVVLDEAQKRLAIYEQEINAREILANSGSAAKKIKSGDFTGLFDLAQANETVMKYSVAKKNLSDIQATYNKIKLQIQELGTEFDDINDSTAETKANVSDLKQELSDGLDDLKDAKKYIEDLVELTMAMIKKNKELEKDGLKEKLDNFKKLIARQKELLKLQQEEKKFNDELKDQNKDLLKIKQELDALSVEGVEYSLEDMKRRAELEEQYVEQSKKRDDFLYDHEIETRENALDKEQESFEEQINTQVKAIEDYLDKTGRIRQDAIDLINGKSQEFYNDLMTYTMTYTDKSMHEFTTLWNHAYDALMKYGNGQIDVDMVLALLGNDILATEAKIKSLEASANAASNSTKNGINATREAVELLNRELEEAAQNYNNLNNQIAASPVNTVSPTTVYPTFQGGAKDNTSMIRMLKLLPKFHDGGIVGGNGEVFAKLMSGEVVSTQKQAETFLNKTLPNLVQAGNRISTSTNNNSSFSLGGITINGNADSNTVSQLKNLQKNIGDIIFKIINDQNKIYNGRTIRG